jgi:8-oxo-dGTP diphosphatase
MKLTAPDFQYCPFCARPLEVRQEERTRKYCTGCSWTYYPHVAVSVTGMLIDNGRALLVKRRREPFCGTWLFPSGFVEYGEHPSETLCREFAEETGISIEQYRLVGISQSEDDPREYGHFIVFYEVESWSGKLRNDPNENEAVAWFGLDVLPDVSFKLHRQYLEEYARGHFGR